MVPLLRTAHFTFAHDGARRLVCLARTAHRLEVDEIDGAFAGMLPALTAAGLDPARLRLLVDVRDGPARNDPAFEAKMNVHMQALVGRFEKCAVLVRSAVGVLQVKRLVRPYDDAIEGSVFRDEAERAPLLETFRAAGSAGRREAAEDLFWALLTSREFLFQH